MVQVYDNGSIYVGEMNAGQRNGKGAVYVLDDFFAGYKLSGNWQNDKLHGWGQLDTRTYVEVGAFDNGVKTGTFFRYYSDGTRSAVDYDNGKQVSEEKYSKRKKNLQTDFACIQLSESEYFLGDVWNSIPFGYGMVYNVDNQNNIVGKLFCQIYGQNITQFIQLDENSHEINNN